MPYKVRGWFDGNGIREMNGTSETADGALTKARGIAERDVDHVTVTDAAGREYSLAAFEDAVAAREVK